MQRSERPGSGRPPAGRRLSVRRDDNVVVIAGKDRGKRGKVLRVDRALGRVVVEGAGKVHRHQKPSAKVMQGGIIEQENGIPACAVMIVCGSCKRPTRVGHMLSEDGKRVRRCVRCGAALDK